MDSDDSNISDHVGDLDIQPTWGYSLHGETHTISNNMAVALTKVRWA
jgi:hypothetical protein